MKPVPPNRPAFGFSAVPSPNNRNWVAVALTVGLPSNPPVVVTAAALPTPADLLSSRRDIATAAHASGPAAGPLPSVPPPNQASNRSLNPATAPPATGAADITGAAAAAATCPVLDAAATEVAADGRANGRATDVETEIGCDVAADAVIGHDPAAGGVDTGALTGAVTGADSTLAPPLRGRSTTGAVCVPRSPRTGAGSAITPAAGNTPEPREPDGDSAVPVDPTAGVSAEPAPLAVRAPPCAGREGLVDSEPPEPRSDPVEPADPLVSATATDGTDTTAAPIPNATARAPTRPTYRPYVEVVTSVVRRSLTSILRTGFVTRRVRRTAASCCRAKKRADCDDDMTNP